MPRKNKAGFTLIEMLVVVSIISTMSSVVLSAVKNVRIKSDEAAKSKILNEYINTLYLIYDETGKYPPLNWLTPTCLASFSDNKCGENNAIYKNTYFSSFFDKYLSELPSFKPVVGIQGTYEGPYYECGAPSASLGCASAWITYWVPANESCPKTSLSSSPGVILYDDPLVRGCYINVVLQN